MRFLIAMAGLVVAFSVAGCVKPLTPPYTPTPHPVALAPTKSPRSNAAPPPTATSVPIPPAAKVLAALPVTPEPTLGRAVKQKATTTVGPVATPTSDSELASSATPSPPAAPGPSATPTFSVPLAPGLTAISIWKGSTTDKVVALTYDAGADRGEAADLLAFLEEARVKVTFGLTGRWGESNPDMVRRIVFDGDELMNHSYDHRSMTGFSSRGPVMARQDRIEEIARTESIVQSLSGATTKPFFRPPYGDQDESVLRDVAAAGYRYSVLWTVDSLGWRGASVGQIVGRCLREAQPGAIYVLHIGLHSKDVEATPLIVYGLESLGYRFVTVGQLVDMTSH